MLVLVGGLLLARVWAQERPLAELINTAEPFWPELQQWIATATNPVEVLPVDSTQADSALWRTQVTTRSPLGTVVHNTGGILVDQGWVRILGSGSPRLPRELMPWNKGKSYHTGGEPLGFLLVADDAAGGFFAINAGALDSIGIGQVFYSSPDDPRWVSTGLAYGQLLYFFFHGDLAEFYTGVRWAGWEQDVAKLSGDQAIFFFPFLFTVEGKDVNKVTRNPVPIQEIWDERFGH